MKYGGGALVQQIIGEYRPDIRVGHTREVRHPVHFILVVAAKVERDALLDVMEPLPGEAGVLKVFEDDSVYFVGTVGMYNCVLVWCNMGATGRNASILATLEALKTWRPTGGVIMPGIAFGRDGASTDSDKVPKQILGDVIVATQIIPYEIMRMSPAKAIGRGPHPESDLRFCERLKNLDWTWTAEGHGAPAMPRPLQHGPLLSGEKLIDDPTFKRKLFEQFPQALGGEMEGAGVYAAAQRGSARWIVVKAICDWGDGSKTKEYQPLAARNSIAAVRAMLSEPGLAPEAVARCGAAAKAPDRSRRRLWSGVLVCCLALVFVGVFAGVRLASCESPGPTTRGGASKSNLTTVSDAGVGRRSLTAVCDSGAGIIWMKIDVPDAGM